MKYCTACGGGLVERMPPGDNRLRQVCIACSLVHYRNPKIIAGCLAVHDDRILLCRRAIAPREGYWTLPAGFMELGETTEQAAARETLEEAKAQVADLRLYTIFDLPHVGQVYMLFRSRLVDGQASPGAETHAVCLYKEQDIPWDALAFPTIRHTLDCFYADTRRGSYRLHTGVIVKRTVEDVAKNAVKDSRGDAGGYEFIANPG